VEREGCLKQIDELLNLPQQSWLLGAGISKEAGIPLMYPLTKRVENLLKDQDLSDYRELLGSLPESAHVEHVLSHIGDLLAIAARSKDKKVVFGKMKRTHDDLKALHARIQSIIRDTMRWGYSPAENERAERVGTANTPIVVVDHHMAFAKALFGARRAGLDRRSAIAFFTINYDTLLEDALALLKISATDGFSGGSMAYWDPLRPEHGFSTPFSSDCGIQARVYKLHGSIDWFVHEEDTVVRLREGAGYPVVQPERLLIYPQATKYRVTQRDPFAALFAAFRSALNSTSPGLLCICGYSFGDEHVNEEIERALKQRGNELTVLAFVRQASGSGGGTEAEGDGLPSVLANWLNGDGSWKERVIVVSNRGVYHGSTKNCLPAGEREHSWWSFDGLTRLLERGPEGQQ